MNSFEVQKAHTNHANGIGDIIKAVWPDSEVNINRIENVLDDPLHSTIVVVVDDDLAGFVDGFMTTSVNGVRRWEVDLLAVRPDYQRRGIASALVEAGTIEGRARGAELARGLVAVDNTGSQKSFTHCGYRTDGTKYDLIVCSSRSHEPSRGNEEEKAYILPVKTINYTGFWIEGELNLKSLEEGKRRLATTDFDVVGAVTPENQNKLIQDGIAIGYERIGRYQWWQRPLISS